MGTPWGRHCIPCCICYLFLVLLGAFLVEVAAANAPLPSGADVKLEPTKEDIPGGSYAIWQIPASPLAILFIAHGMHGVPDVFWDSTSSGFGLPEERLITKSALARGYAVVAVADSASSTGWDLSINFQANADFLMVTAFLRSWRQRHGLEALPLTAFGVSRGGDFVSVLALGEKVEGIVPMICRGVEEAFQAASDSYPPTLFIHMPRDSFTKGVIQEHKALLASKGVVTEQIEMDPFPIHESYFAERIPLLGLNYSSKIFEAMRPRGYLTEDLFVDLPLTLSWANYEEWNWLAMVESLEVLQRLDDGSLKWGEEVTEEISLSYAFHACSSLRSVEMFDWLDATWNKRSFF